VSIEEVRALVAERQRYDEWLASLESKRADTPSRVFDRVYADYVGRRSDVITQLQSHVGELSAFGTELEHRLSDLETQLSANEEELAEGMLRNLVGEYDDDQWATVREAVEGRITTLGGERDALLLEVEDVRTLLSSARVTPPVSAPVTAVDEDTAADLVAPAASALADTPEVVVAAVGDAADDAVEVSTGFVPDAAEPVPPALSLATVDDVASLVLTPMAATEAAHVDEEPLLDIDVSGIAETPALEGPSHEDGLADVAALFDTASMTVVPGPEPTATAAPVSESEVDDALALFGEVSGPADQEFVQSLQGIEAEHELQAEQGAATGAPSAAPNAASANDPFDDLAFLRSVIDPGGEGTTPPVEAERSSAGTSAEASGEPQKTLRCTECGTLNLPTEWYCERCGGELAAF
jgi:hypothetical protein